MQHVHEKFENYELNRQPHPGVVTVKKGLIQYIKYIRMNEVTKYKMERLQTISCVNCI